MDTKQIAKVESEQEPLADFDPGMVATEGAWAPVTIRDLEWALECVGESEAEIAAIEEQAKDAHKRIDSRVSKLTITAERRASFFRGRIAEFAEKNRADLLVGKKKSREFVSGRIGWRKKGGRLRVVDKEPLAVWLATQDERLYRVKLEPQMDELQAHAKATGEVPPGCEWEDEHDEIHVEATPLLLQEKTP